MYYYKLFGLILKSKIELPAFELLPKKNANRHDIECSVCGEIASDFKWVKPIINVGIRALSVSPYFVPIIKDNIRKI